MPREIISEVAGKPYSRGTRNGNMIFVSGQMGLDGNDKEIPGGVGPQMVQTMEYIKEILAEAGATLDDVMMTNVYMADLEGDYDEMNRVYREYFGSSNMPARATVEISRLAFDLKVDVSCIAIVNS